MAFIKSLRDGVLTLEDGTSPTSTLLVLGFSEGDLTARDVRNYKEIRHRGALQQLSAGDEAPIEVSFSVKLTTLEAPILAETTLDANLSAGATTISITDPASFPASWLGGARVEGENGTEIVTWTGKAGGDLTGVTRGVAGTTAVAASSGSRFVQYDSTDRTAREFLLRRGGYSGLVSTRDATTNVFTANVIFAVLDKDGGSDEIVTFQDFYPTSIEIGEGDDYGVVQVSGRCFDTTPLVA